jgi:hypothetical protein
MELEREAVDRVLRRASDMTASHPAVTDAPGRLSEQIVIEAAAEAGIDVDAVRVSLAIERLGVATPTTRGDGTLGPAKASIDRVIALDSDTLLGRLDDLLQRQHGMNRARSAADRGEWRKRTDLVSAAQRLARRSVPANVGKLAGIEARCSSVDAQRTLVRLIADRSPQRTTALTSGGVVAGSWLAATGVAAVLVSPLAMVVAPFGIVAGVILARRGRRQHRDLSVDLENLLDTVERGIRPVSLTEDVRRVLRRLR